jgi:hypothetical protein
MHLYLGGNDPKRGGWWCVDVIINYIEINISMSKDEKDDFLRYGQGILLRGFKS